MRKLGFKVLAPAMIIFFGICAYRCSCPCYLEQTFKNLTDVRIQTNSLIASSNDSIKNHLAEIQETEKIINSAINQNNGRKGCKEIGKIWSHFKNDSTGVYDMFISDWKKNKVLPIVYTKSITEDINKILDQIEAGEDAIKEKKKPCK